MLCTIDTGITMFESMPYEELCIAFGLTRYLAVLEHVQNNLRVKYKKDIFLISYNL